MNKKKHLVIIAGPTAVGKTAVAVKVAQSVNTEIISCDSRQMYREMSIGTAVPSPEELKAVRHHFIQTLSIYDYYNASIFEQQALDVLRALFDEKDVVVMTGGSGLYSKAVKTGIDDIPTIDPGLRKELIELHKQKGLEEIRQKLKELDPDYYSQVDLNNPKRILKALEISLMTGKPYSSFLTGKKKERDFTIITIGLDRERKELYGRINSRVDQMVQQGLLSEARSLYDKSGKKNINALNTVGYRELFDHFDGKAGKDEAIEQIKSNTRKYARKQLTWLRKDEDTRWFHPAKVDEIIQYINEQTGKKNSVK
jgi:tRNA dimethylallyltransferase